MLVFGLLKNLAIILTFWSDKKSIVLVYCNGDVNNVIGRNIINNYEYEFN